MAVVTIARQYGAGGRIVGQMVADQMNYQFIDQEILDLVARSANVSKKSVQEIDRLAGDKLTSLIGEWLTSSRVKTVPGISTEFDEAKFKVFLKRVMTEIAAKDKAVIIGRGGQFILRDHPKAVCIYLVAKEEDRIDTLMKRYGVTRTKAEDVASKEDSRRLAFLRGFEMGDPEDLSLYHLIINTSHTGFEAAAEMIRALIRSRERLPRA